MKQLKPKEVAEYRTRMWVSQGKKCSLCQKYIPKKEAALDHCHAQGHVRSVLHRNCNGLEGRILSFARRSGVPPAEFLKSLLQYWRNDYSGNPLHPNHLNDDQKKLKLYRKRMKTAKRESTKAKYRALIRELT
jgi:hypothetical protein